jgi:hypothetical protein
MRALYVIVGVAGSCLAELVLSRLPTPALEAGHGDGRELVTAGVGFANCANATKTDWETCRTAVPRGEPFTCPTFDRFEAMFKCDVDFIFTCADLRAVENDQRVVTDSIRPDMCSDSKRDDFARAPIACPTKTYPNMAAVVAKACAGLPPRPPATPRPTFSFEAPPSPRPPSTDKPTVRPTLSERDANLQDPAWWIGIALGLGLVFAFGGYKYRSRSQASVEVAKGVVAVAVQINS